MNLGRSWREVNWRILNVVNLIDKIYFEGQLGSLENRFYFTYNKNKNCNGF